MGVKAPELPRGEPKCREYWYNEDSIIEYPKIKIERFK
jgi:hypothetical protein